MEGKRKCAEINQEFEQALEIGIAPAEERKTKGIEFLKRLKVDNSLLNLYESDNVVSCFCGGIALAVEPKSILERHIKEIEVNYNCTVFAVICDNVCGVCMLNFLIVSEHRENWKYNITTLSDNDFTCLAYVHNVDDERLSEMGTVYLRNVNGNLLRIG